MPDLCGCDPDRVLDYVYLGPDEDIEHRNSVLFAQERYLVTMQTCN